VIRPVMLTLPSTNKRYDTARRYAALRIIKDYSRKSNLYIMYVIQQVLHESATESQLRLSYTRALHCLQ